MAKRRKARGLFVITALIIISLLLPGSGAPWAAAQVVRTSEPPVTLYSSAPDEPDSQLQAIVEDVVGNLGGDWGVAVKKLDTGQFAAFNGDKQQISASLYKMWVLNELYRQVKAGIVSLDDTSDVTSEDAYFDSIQGNLALDVGTTLTLRRAAYLMVTVSDNTAAAFLVRVLGPDNINRFMKQNGLDNSLLDWTGVGDNLTTPIDMMREMEMIATSQMVDADSSKQMIEMMLDQQINNLIPPGLPDGVPYAHKTGALDLQLHDAGIVYGPSGPFVIVAMASNMDSYQTVYDKMPELATRVYNYFNDHPSSPALYFPETRQSVGHDFLKFWNEYGGLKNFGYPIGPEEMQGGILVQQFERARFELHPENAGSGGASPEVVLGLIGQERASQLNLSWARSDDPGEGKYFPTTGQAITGGFYDYWLNNGGERTFGFPISPAANMTNPNDGKTYLTQWFQRARMELHPDLPEGHRIVLGALGSELASSPGG
ncbi:MAG: serine hydrolase [Chloroflexi bacterium]|nr:serine hydrolase [Chloroflexota bacterium]